MPTESLVYKPELKSLVTDGYAIDDRTLYVVVEECQLGPDATSEDLDLFIETFEGEIERCGFKGIIEIARVNRHCFLTSGYFMGDLGAMTAVSRGLITGVLHDFLENAWQAGIDALIDALNAAEFPEPTTAPDHVAPEADVVPASKVFVFTPTAFGPNCPAGAEWEAMKAAMVAAHSRLEGDVPDLLFGFPEGYVDDEDFNSVWSEEIYDITEAGEAAREAF